MIFLQILSWCEVGECQDTVKASCSLQFEQLGAKHYNKDSRAEALSATCYPSEATRASQGQPRDWFIYRDKVGLRTTSQD